MDKRLLLFLALTALVLIVTPRFLPHPPVTPPARGGADSTLVASAPGAPAGTTTAQRPAAPASAPESVPSTPAPPATVRTGGAADTTAPPVRADTIAVRTKLALYQFSTLGATPLQVQLNTYKALTKGDGSVQLARPGLPLAEYRLLIAPSDTIALDRTAFAVDSSRAPNGDEVLSFRATVRGAAVTLRYTFAPDSYLVHVRGSVAGGATGQRFLLVTLPNGLRTQEADTTDDQREMAFAVKPHRDDARSISFGKLDAAAPTIQNGPLTWVASRNKYFVLALFADTTAAPFGAAVLTALPHPSTKVAANATATVVQPIGQTGAVGFDMYAGPQEWRRLLALGRDFENVNPYGGFLRPVVQPFSTIVMRILLWTHDLLRVNYGWVLIIFGVVVRLILWPLNQSAMRSSLRLQRIQPELQAIQKKYKNNLEKQQAEMMRLYREHGMSPFSPIAGCLPMLIPMPVLYALFFVLRNTIELRGVHFLWLADLSLKDPYYILPILMGVSMYVLSWIGLRSSPPNAQAKMMAYVFPVMMTVLFLNLASGLNLYYAVQNFAALPQQWLIAQERAKVGPSAPARATG